MGVQSSQILIPGGEFQKVASALRMWHEQFQGFILNPVRATDGEQVFLLRSRQDQMTINPRGELHQLFRRAALRDQKPLHQMADTDQDETTTAVVNESKGLQASDV